MAHSDASLRSLRRACEAGLDCLFTEDILRAAVAGASVLEDDPLFNAGYGSVLAADGMVEVDAAVVRGSDGRYGGVAAARGLRHPARVAEMVLESADAVLLSGRGAEEFAARHGIGGEDLITPEQREIWRAIRSGEELSRFTGRAVAPSTETVGCIAIRGREFAAASSTGGVCGKPTGRIGDSAILGAGLWADTESAVLCSGEGEAMISLQLARRVADRLAGGQPAQQAVAWAVELAADVKGAVCAVLAAGAGGTQIAAAHSGVSFPVVASNRQKHWVVDSERIEVRVK